VCSARFAPNVPADRSVGALEHLERPLRISVICVDDCKAALGQRSRSGDDSSAGTSSRSLAVWRWPLLPSAAKGRRRGASRPRCEASARRVTSDTEIPDRRDSRANAVASSSGSVIVVRFIGLDYARTNPLRSEPVHWEYWPRATSARPFQSSGSGKKHADQRVPGDVMNVAVDALVRRVSGERPSVLRSALAAAVVGGAAAAITYHLLRRSGGKAGTE
jgi:hypothetical protein